MGGGGREFKNNQSQWTRLSKIRQWLKAIANPAVSLHCFRVCSVKVFPLPVAKPAGTQACPMLKHHHRHWRWIRLAPLLLLWPQKGSFPLCCFKISGHHRHSLPFSAEWEFWHLTPWCLVWFLGQRRHSIHACTAAWTKKQVTWEGPWFLFNSS